ncbi:MAG TPA: hypothetical protein VFX65_04190 [Candidatus Limnocylindrales bacterium]|nr:hypothetical protein [Candidatus Limnocylindrales bacterium]
MESSVPAPAPTLARRLLPWWPAIPGLLAGAYLGYEAGYVASRGGLAGIGAAFIYIAAGGLVLLLGVIGSIILATRASRAAGRGLLLAAGAVLVGTVGGSVAVPTFDLGYHDPVVRSASGTATLRLDGAEDFVAIDVGEVTCHAVPDGLAVSSVWALELGELNGGTVRSMFTPPGQSGGDGTMELFIDGADIEEPAAQPSWTGSGTFTAEADGAAGEVSFASLALQGDPKSGAVAPGWPATLGGRLTWACDPWLDPDATPPAPGIGEVQLALPGEDLRLAETRSVSCDYEVDGTVQGITAFEVYRLQDWPITVTISLDGGHRIGGELHLSIQGSGKEPPPGQQFMPSWVGFATIEAIGDDERTGALSFDDLPTGVEPSIGPPPAGWPETLSGTITWSCV